MASDPSRAWPRAITYIQSHVLIVVIAALAGSIAGWSTPVRTEFDVSGGIQVAHISGIPPVQELLVVPPAVLASQINAGDDFRPNTANQALRDTAGRHLALSARVSYRVPDMVEVAGRTRSPQEGRAQLEAYVQRIAAAHAELVKPTLNRLTRHYAKLSAQLQAMDKARDECDERLTAIREARRASDTVESLMAVVLCGQIIREADSLAAERKNWASAIDLIRSRPTRLLWSDVRPSPWSRTRNAAAGALVGLVFAIALLVTIARRHASVPG